MGVRSFGAFDDLVPRSLTVTFAEFIFPLGLNHQFLPQGKDGESGVFEQIKWAYFKSILRFRLHKEFIFRREFYSTLPARSIFNFNLKIFI